MQLVQDDAGRASLRPTYVEMVGFFAVAAVAYGSLLVGPRAHDGSEVLVSFVLVALVGVLVVAAVRRDHYTWVDPVGVWLSLFAFVPLRDATGGTATPLTPLIILPLLWSALFLRRRALFVTVVLVVADFVVPLLIEHGQSPQETARAWRSAVLWSCVGAFVAPTVHRLVRQVCARWSELQAAETRWRVVMDHLPDATIVVARPDTTIELVTGAGALKQGMADQVGQRLADVTGPNGPVLEQLVSAAAAGHESTTEMVSSRVGDEHEVHVAPLPGRTRQALLLARNVSLARAYERELRTARDAAEQLFAHSPQPIAVLDADGVLVRVNAAFELLFETVSDDVVGRHLAELSDRPSTTVAEHLIDVVHGDSHQSRAQWRVQREGTALHLVLSSTLLAGPVEGTVAEDQRRVLMTLVDVSERHEHELALAHLANHDPLTGLANRRLFNTRLVQHVDFGRRYGPRGALLLLDLDHFKEVNDTLGHAAGDQLIISIAGLLSRAVRSTDVVARLGGDEFAILLQETDREGAERVADTVAETIRAHAATLEGSHRKVTSSIGVVVITDAAKDAADLLADADMSMYDAKDAGRNGYAVLDYRTDHRPRTATRIAWTERIEEALLSDAFVLHLQPVEDVRAGRIVGAEALLRLADTDQLVYPAEFLYIAERSDLVVSIDQWVLRHAVVLLEQIQVHDPGFRLEVNLSGRSIGRPEIEETLRTAFAGRAVDPRGLVLEITETVAVSQVEAARAFAERVHALGCTFALDDFGAGFGSFYYLKHLLFDYVKIDGEFVAQIHRNPVDRSIVRSIVGLAHSLGKKVVAEFVSEPAVHEVIAAEGVDLAQGYHIGRPQPAEEFLAALARTRGLPVA